MKQFSIVIPVFNEEKYIGNTLKSVQSIHYPKDHFEVVVASDGSTDRSVEIVKQFPDVRLVALAENMGRYISRQKGAEAARNPHILFIDARAEVDSEILNILNQLDDEVVSGYILSTEKITPFETFYLSIRRIVFRKFFKNYNKPFYLTPENFDTMPKGTTVLCVKKERLFEAYADLSDADMGRIASDDTKMLWTIVKNTPILVHPAVKITYIARTSFLASVRHLFERAPRFVDYYLDPTKRNFWLVIIIPLALMFFALAAFILTPLSLPIKISTMIGLDLLLTLVLARSVREFFVILYMLPLCSAIFYAGVLKGIYLKLKPKRAG